MTAAVVEQPHSHDHNDGACAIVGDHDSEAEDPEEEMDRDENTLAHAHSPTRTRTADSTHQPTAAEMKAPLIRKSLKSVATFAAFLPVNFAALRTAFDIFFASEAIVFLCFAKVSCSCYIVVAPVAASIHVRV